MSLNNLAKLSINENRLPSCPRCLCSSEPSSPTPHPVLRTTFSHAGEKEKIDAFSFYFSQKRKCAFTLAEVLITLGIIGVVAAMTISTLIHKYKMHVLEAQFKKAYSVVQNVNSMLKYNDIDPYVDYQLGVLQREEAAAIKQVEDFAKYTKGSRICDGHYYTCTLGKRWPEESKKYKTLDGSNNVHIDPDAYTTKIILLADGSTVWLHTGSTLTYDTNFNGGDRRVKLCGEGFFDIAKDPKHPFTVEVGDMKVCVHGTKFNVRASADNDIMVSLLEGSISLDIGDGTHRQLQPGEIARYDTQTREISIECGNVAMESCWAAGKLSFEKQSLGEVCRYMARWYDTQIQIDQSLEHNYAYTFTITNEPLEEILRIMSRINPIVYTFDKDNSVSISELK